MQGERTGVRTFCFSARVGAGRYGAGDGTFWIETVKRGNGTFLQLQYTQTVLLNFLGLSWPHVTVATLVKRF